MQNREQSTSAGHYVIKSLIHAASLLRSFQSPDEALRLRDLVERTGLSKGICFRLLFTLHQCGLVEKVGARRYKRIWSLPPPRRYRIGYAAQGQESSFDKEVRDGLVRAADRHQVELIVVDNRYQPKAALRSANQLIREKVDLVIEFQTDDSVSAAIASKYLEAGIPMIAIDIPHPGATYFGANNYEAGLLGGRCLGKWANKHWRGQVDEILLIELARAGSLPRARVQGILAGIKETVLEATSSALVTIDGDGQFKSAMERVRKHLRCSSARHVLVGAANDTSALGALRAFEESGRSSTCVVAGQNAEPEARRELRVSGSSFIASVAYFPEKYGPELVRLALEILSGKPAPPAVFIKHQLITPENVDHFYPNDGTLEGRAASRPAVQNQPARF